MEWNSAALCTSPKIRDTPNHATMRITNCRNRKRHRLELSTIRPDFITPAAVRIDCQPAVNPTLQAFVAVRISSRTLRAGRGQAAQTRRLRSGGTLETYACVEMPVDPVFVKCPGSGVNWSCSVLPHRHYRRNKSAPDIRISLRCPYHLQVQPPCAVCEASGDKGLALLDARLVAWAWRSGVSRRRLLSLRKGNTIRRSCCSEKASS